MTMNSLNNAAAEGRRVEGRRRIRIALTLTLTLTIFKTLTGDPQSPLKTPLWYFYYFPFLGGSH